MDTSQLDQIEFRKALKIFESQSSGSTTELIDKESPCFASHLESQIQQLNRKLDKFVKKVEF